MIQDLIHGWSLLEEKRDDYDEADRYSRGKVDEVFASDVVKMALRETGERYRFNLAQTPITVLSDSIELTAVQAVNDDAANERIAEIWDGNDLDVTYPMLFRRALTFGDGYLMVWPIVPDEDDEVARPETDELADVDLVTAGVEFTYQDPRNCVVIYDEENERRKAFAVKRWPIRLSSGGKGWRADVYYPDVIERWVSVDGQKLTEADGWRPYLGEGETSEEWELVNPFGEIPFFHYRTDIPYGVPVHEGAYGPQDAITKMLITQITTTDSHGFPQRYGLLDASAVLDSKNDEPNWEDDADAEGTQETLAGVADSGQRSGPGTMQEFEGFTEVGQFATADPQVFLDPVELYVRLMAQITNTPLHYFDPSGDMPSGESLKTAEAPKVRKVQWLETLFRGPILETWTFALRLVGVDVQELEVRWAPVESATGAEDWAVVQAKQAAGVPQYQTLVEAGYEPETVAKWLDQNAEAMNLRSRVELLGLVGDAVQKLGAGIALGVLDETRAAAVIEQVLGQAAPAPGTEEAS